MTLNKLKKELTREDKTLLKKGVNTRPVNQLITAFEEYIGKPKFDEWIKDEHKDYTLNLINDLTNNCGTSIPQADRNIQEAITTLNMQGYTQFSVDGFKRFYTEKKTKTKLQTTATTYYTTTPYYTLQSWGGFFPELKLHIEQITDNSFLYNLDGNFGLANVKSEKNKETKNIVGGEQNDRWKKG